MVFIVVIGVGEVEMYAQIKRGRIVGLLLGLCLVALNWPEGLVTANDKRLVGEPPTLNELAELYFLWAERALEEHKRSFGEQPNVHNPTSTQYLKSEFYTELGFKQQDLDRVKQVATLIKILCKTDSTNSGNLAQTFDIKDVPDILRLYVALTEHPSVDQIDVDPRQKNFVENLAQCVYTAIDPDYLCDLEKISLKSETYAELIGPAPNEEDSLKLIRKPTLIQNNEDLAAVRDCPLRNHIHPLNTTLFFHGLNCIYEDETKTFVILRHTPENELKPTTGLINRIGRYVFTTAVRLRYAPSDVYTIMATDKNLETLMQVLESSPFCPNGRIAFKRHENKDIETFKGYQATKRQKERAEKMLKADLSLGTAIGMVLVIYGQSIYKMWLALIAPQILLMYVLPSSIVVLGTVCSLVFFRYIKPSATDPTKLTTWQRYAFALLVSAAIIGLSAVLMYFINTSTGELSLFNVIVLGYQILAPVSIIISIAMQMLPNQRWPKLNHYSYWLLYALSFLLAIAIPSLSFCGLALTARMLLQTHILTVSSTLFSVGALINVFGPWLDEDREKHTAEPFDRAVQARMLKLAVAGFVMIITIGLAVWVSNNYNLLANNIADIKDYNLLDSLIAKLTGQPAQTLLPA
ncbi:hypothetical protein NEHOM01_0821 [Nematocida homosporus]|uniref:uncharacterized protein n=1 Tax=Nematocida homosporus TaxID=1912981 RepID=UPI0022208F2F|nr:uncharacterized protein NEHOM01_0821 [Nematocida homosporus]KAI5185406.1 hypothetical protein NEHOM01_0821 [Nematocida homosporus]